MVEAVVVVEGEILRLAFDVSILTEGRGGGHYRKIYALARDFRLRSLICGKRRAFLER
jgi:hypothetical protein